MLSALLFLLSFLVPSLCYAFVYLQLISWVIKDAGSFKRAALLLGVAFALAVTRLLVTAVWPGIPFYEGYFPGTQLGVKLAEKIITVQERNSIDLLGFVLPHTLLVAFFVFHSFVQALGLRWIVAKQSGSNSLVGLLLPVIAYAAAVVVLLLLFLGMVQY